MKKIIVRIVINVAILVLFLGLLEAGLRITGYFYSLNRANSFSSVGDDSTIREEEATLPTKEGYAILCLGDSYTYAGNVPYNETYPSRLQRKLADGHPSKKYSVINGGVCEYNSKQVLVRLPGFIKKYKPNMIILLVGSSDRFNLAGYNFHEGGIKNLLRNLRVYKMFKIITLNLKAKVLVQKAKSHRQTSIQESQGPVFGVDGYTLTQTKDSIVGNYFAKMESIDSYSEDQPLIEKAWYYYNRDERQEAISICEKALKANPNSMAILCNLAHFYYSIPKEGDLDPPFFDYDEEKVQQALILYNKALQTGRDSELVLAHLAFFYFDVGQTYLCHNKGDLAVKFLCKTMELDVANYVPYYLVARAYKLQSKYDADYIINVFQKMEKNNPELRRNKLFVKYLAFFKNQEEWERKIDEKLQENLKKIVELCQRKNIKVVIQNYPYPYTTANRILKDIAAKYSLPFVDNGSVFKELVASKGQSAYFIDDEHCTVEGYRILADNLYSVLISKDIMSGQKH